MGERRLVLPDPCEVPDDDLDEELRVMGVNPDVLADRGVAFVAQTLRELGRHEEAARLERNDWVALLTSPTEPCPPPIECGAIDEVVGHGLGPQAGKNMPAETVSFLIESAYQRGRDDMYAEVKAYARRLRQR